MGPVLEDRYGIPRRRLTGLMSPWCLKRLDEFGGDLSKFRVVKLNPSRLRQIAVAKTEPGDENNQDISSLVGKVDIASWRCSGRTTRTPTASPAG
jgi:serine protein kinase